MRRSLRTRAGLALPAALAILAGCDTGFTPQSFVDKPRILGIRADPPEVPFSDTEQGSVTLTAFLALPELPKEGPPGPREVKSLDWTMCVLNLGSAASYQCAVDEIPVDGDPGTGTATFDGAILYLGLELIRPRMPMFIEFVKQTVAQDDECQLQVIRDWDACLSDNGGNSAPCIDAGFAAEKTCLLEQGQDITFRLTATWTDGTTDLVADAYKKVRFRRVTTGRPGNRNPGFVLTVEDKAVAATGQAPAGTVLACPDQQFKMVPVLADGTRETYLDAKGASQKEILFFSWYTTVGSLDRLKSSTSTAKPSDPIDLSNLLTLPGGDDVPASFPVWVFLRDDRLGLDGLTFRVQRRADAECEPPAGHAGTFTQPPVEVIAPEAASPVEGGAP